MNTISDFKRKLSLGCKLKLVSRLSKIRKSGEKEWDIHNGNQNFIGVERTITAVRSQYVELNGSVLTFPKKSELIEFTEKGFILEYVELGDKLNSTDIATTLAYEFC